MSLRALRSAAGLSLVELLVTVVLAGIVFAAMVPMFLLAQETNAGDNMRTTALQLAQDRIEKIRQLDYDEIAADAANPDLLPNLYSTTFGGGQFGPTFVAESGGSSKTFHIDYTVTLMPIGSPVGGEEYKKVVVDVYWDPPPRPVKRVILQTNVYRQYAGPQIVALNVSPLETVGGDTVRITGYTVQLEAVISAADIAAMNAGGSPSGFVRFTVNAYNGSQVSYEEVATPVTGQPGVYRTTWDASAAPDGVYVFQAVAVSRNSFKGNTASVAYPLEHGAPAAPTGLVATSADQTVYLTWDASPAGDLDHYELWRGDASGAETFLTDVTAASFEDTGLTNGQTYYYYVKVVDTSGGTSPASAEASATPGPQSDTEPPTVPGDFAVVKNGDGQPSIRLDWSASVDQGVPVSGLMGYQIERGSSSTGPWQQLEANYPPSAIFYVDATAGWSSTWYYRMRALDNAGNASGYTDVRSATTDPQPKYRLTVRNDHTTMTVFVRVQSVATGLWYTQTGSALSNPPAEVSINKKGKSKTWNNLPSGIYNVFGRYGSSTQTKLGDLSGGPQTVVFP